MSSTISLSTSGRLIKAPRLKWTKAMNYLLAISVYRQQNVNAGGNKTIRWQAVLELVNATFDQFPTFVRSYPIGLKDVNKLKSQYNDRHRPLQANSTEHRAKAWVFEKHLCSEEEQRELSGHLDNLIEAERTLSLRPDSAVVEHTEEAPVWWIEFNVTNAEHTRKVTYHQRDESSEDEHHQAQDGKEGDEESSEKDDKSDRPPLVSHDKSHSPASTQPIGIGARSNAVVNITSSLAQEASDSSDGTHGLANENNKAQVIPETEATQHVRNGKKISPNDPFHRLITKLHSWPRLPMAHSRKVDSRAGQPVIVTRGISTGAIATGEIFVCSSSPVYASAGHVRRIVFCDQVTGQRADVDVLLCSQTVCVACNLDDSQTSQSITRHPRQARPLVHENDIVMVPYQGPTFQPQTRRALTNPARIGPTDVLEVMFTGGKRMMVDVVYRSASQGPEFHRSGLLGPYE